MFRAGADSSAPTRRSSSPTGCRMKNYLFVRFCEQRVHLDQSSIRTYPGGLYNAKMKEHREKNTPKSEALWVSPCANARASLKAYLESGKHVREGEMQMTTRPEELPPLVRREGQNGPFEDKVTLKTASFGAPSNAETIRKGKGRSKGRGKGSRPGGPAVRLDQPMQRTTSSAPRSRCSR